MRTYLTYLLLAPAIVFFSTLVACDDPQTTGAGDPGAEPTLATGTVAPDVTPERQGGGPIQGVEVIVNEWSVSANRGAVEAGAVQFTVKNQGTVDHQFIVVRTDDPVEELPVVDGNVALEQVDVVADVSPFQPGHERNLDASLVPGDYVLLCNVPGHYAGGMRTLFAVR
jgi:hypothetical protein